MADKKTIVIFSCFYEPYMSGAELAVKEIIERLKNRYYFIVVTAHLSGSQKREKRDGYEIRRVGWGKISYIFCAPVMAIKIKPPFVHAVMESYAGIALWWYKIFGGKAKTVLTLQSGDLDMPEKQARINQFVWKKIHTAPDKIVAISSALALRARELGAKDVSIIPNGVDFKEINKIPADGVLSHRIISVARLSAEKGLEYLILAFKDIKNEFSDAQLILVGEGAERGHLEKIVGDEKLYGAVSFLGRLPHNEALLEIKESEVFMLASLGEGMGIVIAEAQALGVPVVGTRVGGIPDVIKDGISGLLVQPRDPVAIAAAVIKIFRNRDFAEKIKAGALQSVKKFDWNAIAGEYDKLYQSLCV